MKGEGVLWSPPCRRQGPDGSAFDKGQALADSTRVSARRAGVRRSLDLASGWWKAARSGPRRPRMSSAGTRCPADRRLGGRRRRHRLVRRGTESPQRDGLAATGY